MTMEGFDYTSMSPARAKALGAKFVIRYIGTSAWKCATPAEVRELQSLGIAVGMVYETTGTTFTGGYSAGVTDGHRAADAAHALGAPAGTPIWFAIDTDTTAAACADYYRGCVDGSGAYKARLYGGFKVIHGQTHGGHWETYAWSGGLVSQHADLYQYKNLSAYDHDRTLNGNLANHSGWLRFEPVAAPVPPAPVPAPTEPPLNIVYEGYHYTRGDKV